MISKELLSKVLRLTIVKVPELDGAILWYKGIVNINGSPYAKELSINIYELAYMCKEWAYSQGYILFSKIRLNSSLASCYFDTMGKHDYEDGYHNDFRAETESEAIFKACQWILTKDSK